MTLPFRRTAISLLARLTMVSFWTSLGRTRSGEFQNLRRTARSSRVGGSGDSVMVNLGLLTLCRLIRKDGYLLLIVGTTVFRFSIRTEFISIRGINLVVSVGCSSTRTMCCMPSTPSLMKTTTLEAGGRDFESGALGQVKSGISCVNMSLNGIQEWVASVRWARV